jgi:outer membrane lipoprotein
MHKQKYFFSIVLILWVAGALSCSVIPKKIRSESESGVPFDVLVKNVEKYTGKTVILGGYILKVENLPDETNITVLQAPLAWGDEPKSKDHSQGRFIISQIGFLDPEVYRKDRKITVAGTVAGLVEEKADKISYSYLKIVSRDIYLWPDLPKYYRLPYDYYWYHPYFYHRWRYPYHGYPYYW